MQMIIRLRNGERVDLAGYHFDGINDGEIIFTNPEEVTEHGPEAAVFDLSDILRVVIKEQVE